MSVELSETYRSKASACLKALEHFGVTADDVVAKYENQVFPDSSVNKARAFVQVLNGTLEQQIFDYFTGACDLVYLRDARLPHEYAADLVLGWMIEDAVVESLRSSLPNVVLTGHDRHREFLSPRKISTQPDIRIAGPDGRLLEIFSDWKSTWRRRGHADLRDRKYHKLVSEQALMLGVAPLDQEGFVIDFATDDGGFEEGYIAAYRKLGYTSRSIRSRLVPLHEAMSRLLAEVDQIAF